MGFSLRKLLNEAGAQINPFDHGQTAATVRNRPAPAVTPPPNSNFGSSLRVSQPQPQQQLSVAAPSPTPRITIDRTSMAPPKAPLPDMSFKGISETNPKNKTIFGWNAAALLPAGNEKTYTVKADRDVVTNKDKFVAQFDQLHPDYQKVLVNQSREQAAKGDQSAANTIKALEESGRLKGNVNDFAEGANDKLGGGLARAGLRTVDWVLPGHNTGGLEHFADQMDPSKNSTQQITNAGKTGEKFGTAEKGAVDVASLLLPSMWAQKGIEGTYRAKQAVDIMTKAKALGLGAEETMALVNKASRLPKLISVGANLASDLAVGMPIQAAQQKGQGNKVDLKTALITTASTDIGLPLVAKGVQVGAPKVAQFVKDTPEALGALSHDQAGFIKVPGGGVADDAANAASKEANNLIPPKVPPKTQATAQFEQQMQDAGLTPRTAKAKPAELPLPGESPVRAGTKHIPSEDAAFVPPEVNKTKFNVKNPDELDVVANEIKGDIQKKVGKRLSNQEVKDYAFATKNILSSAKTREATKAYNASMHNLSEEIGSLINARTAGTLDDAGHIRLNKALLERKAAAADAGRNLQFLKNAADPRERTVLDVMHSKMIKEGADLDKMLKETEKLGANPTPQQLTEFYRKFIPAKKEDWLDKFRYTNMLSSPLTHIVNVTSNAQGVFGVAPVQKLVEGGVDALRAAVTGGERTKFAGEAGSYIKGSVKSLPDAVKKFHAVMTGKELMGNPDFDSLRNVPLATKGIAGAADKTLSFVPKMLEASDQFFTTLAKGGEKAGLVKRAAKGVKNIDLSEVNISKVADDAATYRLFRQELGHQGQGHLLDAIDTIPKAVQEWRNSANPIVRNAAKFTFPFISTPTNIFKQGIEYSPTGFLTLAGNADKTAAAAKAVMGTTVMATAAGLFAANDAISFAEPTDSKQRDAFRAEGKQAYSVKIGNKWYGYSKLHPAIAFNLATVGAVKDALDKGSIDQSTADKVLSSASGVMGFFRDQSYMKSVGDFTSIMQAKDGASLGDIVANQTANTANQVMPFKSMVSWIGRQVDPTQRKVDYSASTPEQIFQSMVKDIPKLNKNVPSRTNPYTGEPLMNPHPTINAFSPVRVSTDQGFGNTTGLNVDQRQITRDLPLDQREPFRRGIIETKFAKKQETAEKDAIKSGKEPQVKSASASSGSSAPAGKSEVRQLSSGKYYAKVGDEYKTYDTKTKADEAVANHNKDVQVESFKNSGNKTALIGDTYYYKKKDGSVGNKSKFDYNADKEDAQIKLTQDRAKASGDYESWKKAATQKYRLLEKKANQYDPETEQDKIDAITLQAENLLDEMAKYNSYGGLSKPKKASARGKSSHGLSYKMTTGSSIARSKNLRSILAAAKVGKA